VKEIRNAIKWVVDGEEKIPLFYIHSHMNIADLLTKPYTLTADSVGPGSDWQTGLPWMTAPTQDLPKDQPNRILNPEDKESFELELFPDCFLSIVEDRELLVSNIYLNQPRPNSFRLFQNEDKAPATSIHIVNSSEFRKCWLTQNVDFERLGWEKARRVVKMIYLFTETLLHRVHQRKKSNRDNCCMCTTLPETRLKLKVRDLLEKSASKEAELNLGRAKLEKDFTFRNDVWYSHTRLQKEGLPEVRDIDAQVFFDASTIRGTCQS
jgi:hypothetical protein